jgi:peptidoglycan hydrolase-like protein with peptidoglycan-binding domain
MRVLLIVMAVVVVIGVVGFVATSVQWRGDPSQRDLGPSEAQQNRAEQHAVQQSTDPQPLTEAHIRGFQEQLDTAGFPTGTDKGAMTPQTEAALGAYQGNYGLPVTGIFDEATQRSLTAGETLTPGRPTAEGTSMPGGTAPSGSPR